MPLVISRKSGQSIIIDNDIKIIYKIDKKRGKHMLIIDAKGHGVIREELIECDPDKLCFNCGTYLNRDNVTVRQVNDSHIVFTCNKCHFEDTTK